VDKALASGITSSTYRFEQN